MVDLQTKLIDLNNRLLDIDFEVEKVTRELTTCTRADEKELLSTKMVVMQVQCAAQHSLTHCGCLATLGQPGGAGLLSVRVITDRLTRIQPESRARTNASGTSAELASSQPLPTEAPKGSRAAPAGRPPPRARWLARRGADAPAPACVCILHQRNGPPPASPQEGSAARQIRHHQPRPEPVRCAAVGARRTRGASCSQRSMRCAPTSSASRRPSRWRPTGARESFPFSFPFLSLSFPFPFQGAGRLSRSHIEPCTVGQRRASCAGEVQSAQRVAWSAAQAQARRRVQGSRGRASARAVRRVRGRAGRRRRATRAWRAWRSRCRRSPRASTGPSSRSTSPRPRASGEGGAAASSALPTSAARTPSQQCSGVQAAAQSAHG